MNKPMHWFCNGCGELRSCKYVRLPAGITLRSGRRHTWLCHACRTRYRQTATTPPATLQTRTKKTA